MHILQEIYVSTVRIKQMTGHDGGCITRGQVIGLLKGCFEQNRFGAHLPTSWDIVYERVRKHTASLISSKSVSGDVEASRLKWCTYSRLKLFMEKTAETAANEWGIGNYHIYLKFNTTIVSFIRGEP